MHKISSDRARLLHVQLDPCGTNLEEHDELHKLCILILDVPPVVDHRRYRHCEQELHSTPKFCTTNLNAMQQGRIDEGHLHRGLFSRQGMRSMEGAPTRNMAPTS